MRSQIRRLTRLPSIDKKNITSKQHLDSKKLETVFTVSQIVDKNLIKNNEYLELYYSNLPTRSSELV